MNDFFISYTERNNGCKMKSISGKRGYIKGEDARKRDWKIFDMESNELLISFDTIDKMIRDGWAID